MYSSWVVISLFVDELPKNHHQVHGLAVLQEAEWQNGYADKSNKIYKLNKYFIFAFEGNFLI